MYSFYDYCEFAFRKAALRDELCNKHYDDLYDMSLEFLDHEKADETEYKKVFKRQMVDQVHSNIGDGLVILRQQLLESAFSVFERFLSHVVEVYLHVFPIILKGLDKTIAYRKIVEPQGGKAALDVLVDEEIRGFGFRSLQEKRDYMRKHLKLTNMDSNWRHDGEEFWKEIDRVRREVVHGEPPPDVPIDFLLRAFTALEKIMFSTAVFAQVDQGVPYEWSGFEKRTARREKPALRGSDS